MDKGLVVITGTCHGIGNATMERFLKAGWKVVGIDKDTFGRSLENYTHYVCDISKDELPDLGEPVNILINNAGVQGTDEDIDVNLKDLIRCTEKYGLQGNISAIVNLASVSAHNGAEFGHYVASKGGVLSYTKWTAKEIAKYRATCNSLSFGGVYTELNAQVMSDEDKCNKIMEQTPLKKWMSTQECAEWIYFVSVINKSMSGQDIIIDNLESLNHTFVW